jgi:hypothetical protein
MNGQDSSTTNTPLTAQEQSIVSIAGKSEWLEPVDEESHIKL